VLSALRIFGSKSKKYEIAGEQIRLQVHHPDATNAGYPPCIQTLLMKWLQAFVCAKLYGFVCVLFC
jgi:hypothetical protein